MDLAGFGDSWLNNGDCITFLTLLSVTLGSTAHNFADIGVQSTGLSKQVDKFKKNRKNNGPNKDAPMIAVIHCGGNNLLQDLAKTMGESVDEILSRICEDIKSAMIALHAEQIKYFVTCDVPFSAVVPEIKMVLECYARANNCTLEKVNVHAIEVQRKLNQAIASMAESFAQQFGLKHIHFLEANELEKWNGEEELFDASRLHPNDKGHAKLQKSLLAQLEEAGFLKESSHASASCVQSRAAAMTPEKINLPSKRTSADVASEQSIEQQFDSIIRGESPRDLRQNEKLDFYGLYKQAKFGDNETVDPGFFRDYPAHKKWEAWMAHKGKSKNQAMAEYVAMFRAIEAKKLRSS